MKEILNKDNSEETPLAKRYEKEDLLTALKVLEEGGIILYPTDTVWGIGCDATNEDAVRKVFALKQRADSKAMLCLLDATGKLQGYMDEVPPLAYDLIQMTTHPLTIIYPDAKNIAPSLLAEDGTVGIRITTEPFSKALCERLHRPIVSTSANLSGEPTARSFREISDAVKQGVDYIVRYRQYEETEHTPSHIIKLGKGGLIKVIR